MPYPRSFARHTMLWTLPDGEVAQCRIHWDENGGGLLDLGDALPDALEARGLALWTALRAAHSDDVAYIGSRTALIGVDGLVHETAERVIAPVPGTATEVCLPTEVSVCVSLRSATYSRSGRGRIFWPPMAVGRLVAGGRFYSGSRDGLADAVAAYCQPLTVGAAEFFPVIASTTQQQLRPIVQVRVGDVFDVQRRRRDAIAEAYAITDV